MCPLGSKCFLKHMTVNFIDERLKQLKVKDVAQKQRADRADFHQFRETF